MSLNPGTNPNPADCTAFRAANRERTRLRQRSAKGIPKPATSIERCCAKCGASFLGLAPGKTGLHGLWIYWQWFCSNECARRPVEPEATTTA